MSKLSRAEIAVCVLAPIGMFWGLMLFAPSDLSLLDRLGLCVLFSAVWGPLMFLRVKN